MPDFVINELNVQSVITAPAHDELVPMQASGNYTVKGFAYSGTTNSCLHLTACWHVSVYAYVSAQGCGLPISVKD